MKKFMILLAAVALLASCSDDDEKIVVKDYGMKTFSADMKYEKTSGMSKDFNCKQQTYFKFGQADAVAVGEYGKASWTTFDILPQKPNKEGVMETNADYNVTTKVKGWDLLFTQYIGDAYQGKGPKGAVMPYFLTGVLVNTATAKVGMQEYKESDDADKISKAFADLKLADVEGVDYKDGIETIGINWKSMKGMPPTYTVKTNWFYIVKLTDGNIYKLRFVSFYGATKAQRIIKVEYALMK